MRPLARRTVMVSIPTEHRRPTTSVIHATAPAAVWASPGRPRQISCKLWIFNDLLLIDSLLPLRGGHGRGCGARAFRNRQRVGGSDRAVGGGSRSPSSFPRRCCNPCQCVHSSARRHATLSRPDVGRGAVGHVDRVRSHGGGVDGFRDADEDAAAPTAPEARDRSRSPGCPL